MPKRLIVNADDFGHSPEVNEAVLRSIDRGIVSSVSLMANGRAFEEAAAAARARPRLAVGVHLSLVDGTPVLSPRVVPTLVDSFGRLRPGFADFARDWAAGRISTTEIARECSAQIARVESAGLRAGHLDGHQHLHMLPGVYRTVMALAGGRRVRYSLEWPRSLGDLRAPRFFLLLAAGALLRPAPGSARLLGMWRPGRLDRASLESLLGLVRPGLNELICHPGAGDAEALVDPAARRLVDRLGIVLVGRSEEESGVPSR